MVELSTHQENWWTRKIIPVRSVVKGIVAAVARATEDGIFMKYLWDSPPVRRQVRPSASQLQSRCESNFSRDDGDVDSLSRAAVLSASKTPLWHSPASNSLMCV